MNFSCVMTVSSGNAFNICINSFAFIFNLLILKLIIIIFFHLFVHFLFHCFEILAFFLFSALVFLVNEFLYIGFFLCHRYFWLKECVHNFLFFW